MLQLKKTLHNSHAVRDLAVVCISHFKDTDVMNKNKLFPYEKEEKSDRSRKKKF